VPDRRIAFTAGGAGDYNSKDNFAHAAVIWKPAKRVTASVGYGGSFVRGNTIFLNPLTPSGTLDFNYQRPYASLEFAVYRGFTYKKCPGIITGTTRRARPIRSGSRRFSCRILTVATLRFRSGMRFERCASSWRRDISRLANSLERFAQGDNQ